MSCETRTYGAGYKWKTAFDNSGTVLDDSASQAFGACLRWRRRQEPLTAAKLRQITSILKRQNKETYDQNRHALPQKLLQSVLGKWAVEDQQVENGEAQTTAVVKKKEARDRTIQEFVNSLDSVGTEKLDRAWCLKYLDFIEGELKRCQEFELHVSPLKFVLNRYDSHVCAEPLCGSSNSSSYNSSNSSCSIIDEKTRVFSCGGVSRPLPAPIMNGLWLEFGVAEGKSLGLIARHINSIRMKMVTKTAQTQATPKQSEQDTESNASGCNIDTGNGAGSSESANSACNLDAGIAQGVVYGFDSFAGLPEDWRPGFSKGHFSRAQESGPKFQGTLLVAFCLA
jgi:hypothetical protein